MHSDRPPLPFSLLKLDYFTQCNAQKRVMHSECCRKEAGEEKRADL